MPVTFREVSAKAWKGGGKKQRERLRRGGTVKGRGMWRHERRELAAGSGRLGAGRRSARQERGDAGSTKAGWGNSRGRFSREPVCPEEEQSADAAEVPSRVASADLGAASATQVSVAAAMALVSYWTVRLSSPWTSGLRRLRPVRIVAEMGAAHPHLLNGAMAMCTQGLTGIRGRSVFDPDHLTPITRFNEAPMVSRGKCGGELRGHLGHAQLQ